MPTTGFSPNQRVKYWQDVCRNRISSRGRFVKVAALGGDGNDTSFEQAFSNLAHAFIEDKAPTLMDHELGFQLLDRNEENTKAVGVFAFKVGSQMIFAPVFFLSGDLKGHELLYLKDQDVFVPLKESWLNYILNRKPAILGSGVDRRTSSLGVRNPNLNRLANSPYKYASAMIPEVQPFLPAYAHLTSGTLKEALADYESHCQERLDLGDFLKQASLPMLESLADLMRRKPKIAQAFDQWHGLGTLSTAVKMAGFRSRGRSVLDPEKRSGPIYREAPFRGSILDRLEKEAADGDKGPDAKQKLKVITWDQTRADAAPEGLDEEDAAALLRDHVLIQDQRTGDEVSVAYNIATENRLSNPPATGLYMVLTEPGNFEKCLVITDPHGPDGRQPSFCTVIRMEGDGAKQWGNYPRGDIWVAGQVEDLLPGGEESWQEFYDGLTDATSFSKGDDRYVLIGPRRNATCPFKVEETLGSDGTASYEVDMVCDCHYGRHLSKGLHRFKNTAEYEWFDEYDPAMNGCRIHLDTKIGTEIRSNYGDIFIPVDYKVIKLLPTKMDSRKSGPWGPDGGKQSDPPPIMPGQIIDAELDIMKKTAALRLSHDGLNYTVNGETLSPRDTLIHLVKDHGLRKAASEELIKRAEQQQRRGGNAFECRVKYAFPYLTEQGPNAPAIPEAEMGGYNPMGHSGPTVETQEEEIIVPGMEASQTDPSIYDVSPDSMPEPMDANTVQRAAASGQKEVFDTAMIGSMLKAVRDDNMVDRYVPDLIKALDRMGRLLFHFYWHQDKFAERFGKQDMPELEDSLRNSFEGVGDLVLFLKQKTIDPFPEEGLRDIDLGDSAEI